ncbi:MAG: hypothetical protein ACMG6S_19990 [Byssovorax sp.]
MARPLSNRVAYGDAIVSRFTEMGIHKDLKVDFAAFKAQHAVFVKATVAVEKAEHTYDDAATKIGKLDAPRDVTILTIADKLPGAGLGERTRPFARFSKYPPSKLVTLPYTAQTNEVRSLLTQIRKQSPAKEIAALCDDGEKQNEAVSSALGGLTVPLATLNEARMKRDTAVPDWEKHYRRLKDAAKVAYRDEAGRFAALFAEPDAVLTHTRPKHRKIKAAGAAAAGGAEASAAAKQPTKHAKRRGR